MSVILAHLSDPHLPLQAYPSVRELLGKRALSLLSWHFRRRHIHRNDALSAVLADIVASDANAIALTGDLTNLGTPAEFRAAAAWLDRLRRHGRPMAVIPGNHDAMVPVAWERGPGLWSTFGGMTDPLVPRVMQVGSVALIGVSSAIPTLPFFAAGRMGEEQAERLAEQLAALGQRGVCRVVMIHHPPREGLVVPRKALRDIALFEEVLTASGAELVLHGHSHRGTFDTIRGTDVPLIGVTSASHRAGRLDRAAGWNRIAIAPEGAGDHLADHPAWHIDVTCRRLGTDGRMHEMRHVAYRRPSALAGKSTGESVCGKGVAP